MAWAPSNLICVPKCSKSPQFNLPVFSINFPASHALISNNFKHFQRNSLLFSSNSIQENQNCISVKKQRYSSSFKAACFTEKIDSKTSLDPVQLLEHDGDWSNEQFWDFTQFLRKNKRTNQVLQVFDAWKERETSRINERNYERIIGILLEERLTEEAASAVAQMKTYGLRLSLDIYTAVIKAFSKEGKFDVALSYLVELKDNGLKPSTEIYEGLIQAYGKYGMYDEMGACLVEMKSVGTRPDHITYNSLIREFAKAGLLKKMEHTYRILLSNRMELQSSTLVSMLEAYTKFRIFDKMEKCTKQVLKSKAYVSDDLIRKVAAVYIEKLMFSRLDELGLGLSLRSGSTNLVWCLRMLSNACACSKKGMDAVINEMESNKVPWNVTIANIMLLSFLKMKDFKHLNILLHDLPFKVAQPDIVTIGILSDACSFGYNSTRVKDTWRRDGYFQNKVKTETDPLVLTAFGKGQFLTDFEDMYASIDFKSKVRRWDYLHLIEVIDTHRKYTVLAKNGGTVSI